jgi:hypothetical protein
MALTLALRPCANQVPEAVFTVFVSAVGVFMFAPPSATLSPNANLRTLARP